MWDLDTIMRLNEPEELRRQRIRALGMNGIRRADPGADAGSTPAISTTLHPARYLPRTGKSGFMGLYGALSGFFKKK